MTVFVFALLLAAQSPEAAFKNDVHSHRGFTCADCHGAAGAGKIPRTAVPKLCARCHSDANLIHRYRPQQRVDQLAQYETSVHGKRLAAGDANVATCIDCHGVHDIREVKDPLSPVHPLRLPETCARCHADAAHMQRYKLSTDQFADYRRSVHWEALAKRGDLSAPSCATCHGNHGAAPPQVASVSVVCGSCHALIEDLYGKSPHKPAFSQMGLAGCVVCHGNHAVTKPSAAMLQGPNAVCSQCHEDGSKGAAAAAEMARLITGLDGALKSSDAVLQRASRSGMEVSEALLRQQEAREMLVKVRVAVHNFAPAAVAQPANIGLGMAAETRRAGENALRERDVRRRGLAISLIAILVTMAGLGLAIRALERRRSAAPEVPGN